MGKKEELQNEFIDTIDAICLLQDEINEKIDKLIVVVSKINHELNNN